MYGGIVQNKIHVLSQKECKDFTTNQEFYD
jgi:hypothetical protein